ncbi:transforming growth factor-beta-induced protein ig-h3-like [Littorina saxatilis]|uniref:FAS1 domain-containing protein n=1 Tax=Littorina saxatilis TaxID=31220 RepID=A0AAN9BAE2_9CAEN
MLRCVLAVCAVAAVYGQTDNLVQLATKIGATDLVKVVTQAGLADTLANKGPFTVFAPSNEAFARVPKRIIEELERNKTLLTDLLLYHVTNGKVLSTQLKNGQLAPSLFEKHDLRFNIYNEGKLITAEGSPVALADQQASNGVIHLLNKVIFPIPEGSVVDFVSRDPFVSTLLKAVVAANLVKTLEGGPFTVFAPTNEAFNRLPPGALDKLLANVTALAEVLTYHVVKGTVYAEGLTNGERVATVEGQDLSVRKMGPERVIINNAMVERADISVTNGVIHVINNVLIPPPKK